MSTSRTTLALVTVVLLVGAVGAGVYLRLSGEGDEGSGAPEAATAGADPSTLPPEAGQQFATDVPQPVRGVPAVRDTLWISVAAAGQAEAIRMATLVSQVAGAVEEVRVRENQRVGAGDVLVVLDTTEFALAVDRARADFLRSEAEFRQIILFDDEIEDVALREERERLARSRSGLEQARVSLREAELDLERTRIRAPFAGRVADLQVVEGEHLAQGTELLVVVALDPIKVEVQVLESELGSLEEGRRATATFAAFPGEPFQGRIETLNPLVDPETRTARATLLLPNPDGRLRPGMYARVTLDARNVPDRILVPRAAVLERDRRSMLFVFEGEPGRGRAKWRYVTTGRSGDEWVELVESSETSMVEPGEVVLVEGHEYLVHDALVRLADS